MLWQTKRKLTSEFLQYVISSLAVILITLSYVRISQLEDGSLMVFQYFISAAFGYTVVGLMNLTPKVLIWLVVPVVLASLIGLFGDYTVSPTYISFASTLIMGIPFLGIGVMVRYVSSYDRSQR